MGVGLLVGGTEGLAGVGLAVGNVGYGVGRSVGGCGRVARERFARARGANLGGNEAALVVLGVPEAPARGGQYGARGRAAAAKAHRGSLWQAALVLPGYNATNPRERRAEESRRTLLLHARVR